MSRFFEVIAFDADDTLWHNESRFELSKQKFAAMLASYRSYAEVDAHLLETEVRNLKHFGYGIKGFTLSMIETAVELTEGRIGGREVAQLIELGKDMLRAPVELLEGVREAVAELSPHYRLMLITKGDLFDQEAKLARSGLGDLFQAVEIVSEKDPHTYGRILQRHGVIAERFLMVGNSVKSDILPVLEVGGYAAHVPYEIIWAHEEARVDSHPRFQKLRSLAELPACLEFFARGG